MRKGVLVEKEHRIMEYCENSLTYQAYVDKGTPIGGRSSVQLIAEKGKESFYIKKGFILGTLR